MKKILTYAVLLFMGLQNTEAQNQKVLDSLMRVSATARQDTTKILALLEIVNVYIGNKPDSCFLIAERALQMSQKIGFKKGEANAYNKMGIGNAIKGQYSEALVLFQKALLIFEQIQDKKSIAKCLSNIVNIYNVQGDYPLALTYSQKSLKISEAIGNKDVIAGNLNNIGNIHKAQGNYPLALEYYQKTLKISEEIGNRDVIANSLMNIGNIYNTESNYPLALEYYQKSLKIWEDMGNQDGLASNLNNIGLTYNNQGKYALALEHYQKSLKICEEIGNKHVMANNLNNIGLIYNIQENYPLALEYYQKSLKIGEEIGDKNLLTYPLNGMANIYQKQQNYDKSIAYAQRSLQIAEQIKAPKEINDASHTLYNTYKLKGDYVKALEYHELYKTTQDSLFNADKSKDIANLEAQVEIERKDKEIQLLNKDKELDQKEKESIQKDLELQRIEAKSQKNAKLALEKQLEADRFLSLARQEKDKRKSDSLFALSEKSQLEANVFKAQGKTLKAEAQARKAEAIKEKQARAFQENLTYLAVASLLGLAVLAYFIFRSRQAETRAKKKIESQAQLLSEANVMKDQLFSVIAHDLRSPMVGFQDLNKQIRYFLRKNQPEKLERLGQEIEKNATVLNSLLNNLLQWAMLQKNMLRPQIQTVKLQEAVEHCMSNFHLLAQTQIVALKHEVAEDVFLETDYNILQTILRNLVSNALKFTPENGTIYLAYQAQGRQGVLSVSDTGVGMSAEKLQALFGKVQLQNERGVRGEKGIGIGLQLCYELAEKIGARLACQSTEGVGTTFSITF